MVMIYLDWRFGLYDDWTSLLRACMCIVYSSHRGVSASSCISLVSFEINASVVLLFSFCWFIVVRVRRIGGYCQSLTGQLQIRFIE